MSRRSPSRLGPAACCCLLVAMCLSGCPHPRLRLDPSKRIGNPHDLLAAVRQAGAAVKSLRAGGTIVMRQGSKRLKAHVLVLLRRPAFLRFETESFFDQPLSILVTDGMHFSIWDMDHGRFYRGPATPANIARAIPIPMDATEVVGLLAGDPPLIVYAKSELEWQESGRYLLTLSNSRERQQISIDPLLLRPTRIICRQAGRLYYDLVYEDFDSATRLPRKINFEMPGQDIKLRLRLRELEVNPSLADDLFVLTPPSGVPIEQLDSEPAPASGQPGRE